MDVHKPKAEMGVKDLWPLLGGASTEENIVDLHGQSVAVDGYLKASVPVMYQKKSLSHTSEPCSTECVNLISMVSNQFL